ncbi:hypothetical protein KsCSTR_48970 [Candidatus Kuenenia stuttgartiensis]|uniref:Uncharacterized protein n=1 Tax=Kuenenia stuttgartiensis TaxID=174633 RepID=A0A6G7GY41_KUEST|nr:hypothetical protein KsCSTR_48970 [Candidatus Kuenenia stuttgartiensis]
MKCTIRKVHLFRIYIILSLEFVSHFVLRISYFLFRVCLISGYTSLGICLLPLFWGI